MNDYELVVREQKPLSCGSIFCEAKLVKRREDGSVYSNLRLRGMYFVVNKNKKVTQCFDWLLDYKDDLKELGYKL